MTYAVLWCANRESIHAGRLTLLPRSLALDGSAEGEAFRSELRYDAIVALAIGREPGDRLRGRPAAVLETATGDVVRIAPLDGAGLLGEMVERVDEARSRVGSPSRSSSMTARA